MWLKIGKRIALGYGILFTLAGAGLAFANIVGVLAHAFLFRAEQPADPSVLKMWMHGGWFFGVGIGLLPMIVKKIKMSKDQVSRETLNRDHQENDTPPETQESPGKMTEERRHGLLGSLAWGGFFGTILGAILGASFVVLWFSLIYSPFAPDRWASTVAVERQQLPSGRKETVLTTDHPVALYAFGIPLMLGCVAGVVTGGVVGVDDVKSSTGR